MTLKSGAVKVFAQHRSHSAIDAFQARLVDHLIVAPFGPQGCLVNVDNDHSTFIKVQPLAQDPFHPITDSSPAIGAVDIVLTDLRRWRIIGLFATDETGT